jgi:L-alanine-DL-glutamate epimerase-like enolase superfamily enzyme
MNNKFCHAQESRQVSESIIFTVTDESNILGIGECIPRKYVTGETIDSVISYLKNIPIYKIWQSINFNSLDDAIYSFNRIKFPDFLDTELNVNCAIEMAFLDFIGKKFLTNLSFILQKYYLTDVPKLTSPNKLIATSQVMDFSVTVADFLKNRGPFHFIKIKLGNDFNKNILRVKSVREVAGYDVPIIVDANMAWSVDEAIKHIKSLMSYLIAYYEEPLKKNNLDAYCLLSQKFDVKFLLDESLCSFRNAKTAIQKANCFAFNIRISKCGGLRNSCKIIELASKHSVSYQIGAQVAETGPLIAAGRHLANSADGYFTFEAGQADRHFGPIYIISPMPLVDRKTNFASSIEGSGLGITLSEHFDQFVLKKFTLDNNKWQ